MKRLLFHISWCALLFSSCSNGTAEKTIADSLAALPAEHRITENDIVEIAAALPINKGDEDAFFSKFFAPGDSLQIEVDDAIQKHFKGKHYIVIVNATDSLIDDVFIRGFAPQMSLSLPKLGSNMDSAWRNNEQIFLHKDPEPEVLAWYTDSLHRKKKIVVHGVDELQASKDTTVRSVWIRSNIPIN